MSRQYLPEYQRNLTKVTSNALACHARTFVTRIDLRLGGVIPLFGYECLLQRFIASLDSQITAQQKRKRKVDKRVRPNVLRYFWVKEQVTAEQPHYHVILFFNHDVYHRLGRYNNPSSLAFKIKKAWASALGYDVEDTARLVQFPRNNVFKLDINSDSFDEDYDRFYDSALYLCKRYSKLISAGKRSIGYSYR